MNVQIKKAVKAGNSSAVVLPRAWLNKEVRVELVKKTPEIILIDTINLIKDHIDMAEVIGIYLTGSYAREEEDVESDIDVLVITENIDREAINEGIYNILIISESLLKQKLERDLLPVGAMINEAKSLLNLKYLKSIDIKVSKNNIKSYIDSTKEKLDLIKKVISELLIQNKKYVPDKMVYTILLRIRTLHIIEGLIRDKIYSKREFVRLIRSISKGNISYERYLAIKNNLNEKAVTPLNEIERLTIYLEEQLKKIEGLVKGLD